MAYFRCTEIGNATPSPKTPCLVSSGSQIITFPTIDGNQPYIIDTKLRWQSNSPEVSGVYLMGNGHDTSYGGGWCLRVSAGASGASWINVRDAQGNMGGKDPYYDYWYDVLCGPKRSKFYDLDTAYSTLSGDVKDYPMALFGISQFPNKLASIALARTKVTLEEVTIMDLVPVNKFNDFISMYVGDFTSYTGYDTRVGYTYDDGRMYNQPMTRSYYRAVARYTDGNGNTHVGYSTPYLRNDSGYPTVNSFDVPFEDGPLISVSINLDAWASKITATTPTTAWGTYNIEVAVFLCGQDKEGGFYDTVNNKYYFSETSTPLVYTEL